MPLFKQVYETQETHIYEVVIYNDDKLIENLKVEVIYNNGYLFLHHIDETSMILRNQENSLTQSLYEKEQVTLFTIGIDGSYYCKPKIYEIIERGQRDEDHSYNIFKDLMSIEDSEKLTLLEEGKITDKLVIKIITENQNKKSIKIFCNTFI